MDRAALHQWLDDLPDDALPEVRRFLQLLRHSSADPIPPEEREEFDRDCEKELEEYDRTGEYISNEDTMAWLATWGKPGPPAPPPPIRRHPR